MSTILITGAGGFIGSHLAERLRREGNYVIGVDLKLPEYKNSKFITDEFYLIDLRWDLEVAKLRDKLKDRIIRFREFKRTRRRMIML